MVCANAEAPIDSMLAMDVRDSIWAAILPDSDGITHLHIGDNCSCYRKVETRKLLPNDSCRWIYFERDWTMNEVVSVTLEYRKPVKVYVIKDGKVVDQYLHYERKVPPDVRDSVWHCGGDGEVRR